MQQRIEYYKHLGAPADQSVLIAFLKEIQKEHNGIPSYVVGQMAQSMDVKESLILALIRRIPSLRLKDTHCLELCAGPNCGKHKALAALAEKLAGDNVQVRYVPCMRLCGKGPNVKFDAKLYHQADEALLCRLLLEEKES